MKSSNRNKDYKKVDKERILKRIEKEERFQRQQMKIESSADFKFSFNISKNQRKELYKSIISSMEKVVKLKEKLGIKSKDKTVYFRGMLEIVNKNIERSQNRLKRIVLVEKNKKKQK